MIPHSGHNKDCLAGTPFKGVLVTPARKQSLSCDQGNPMLGGSPGEES